MQHSNLLIYSIDIEKGFGEKLSRLNYTIGFPNDTNQGESIQSSISKKSNVHQPYRSDTIKSISFNCELYHTLELASNNNKLTFRELLGLASNLALVESGEKTFIGILKSKPFSENDGFFVNNWSFYFYYLKWRNPYPCSSFCPYRNTCIHGQNILSTCSIRPHQIERVSDSEDQLVSLDEASEDFKKVFNMAVKPNEKVWHIIKSQTVLGKTETVLLLLKDHPEMKILLVVPTNILKREIAERAKAMGIHLVISPSLHEVEDLLSEEVWDDIESLLSAGKSPIPCIIKAIESGKKVMQRYSKNIYMSETISTALLAVPSPHIDGYPALTCPNMILS